MNRSMLLECQKNLQDSRDVSLDKERFAELVSEFLCATGYEQRELAHKIRVSPPTIHRWVSAKNMPYPVTATAIIDLLIEDIASKLELVKMSA